MAGGKKKAKLAHEKRKGGQSEGASFAVVKVIELIGEKGADGVVVEIDDKGTLGIVDAQYVRRDREGNLTPRGLACPATYDPVSRDKAIARYASHSA